MLPTAEGALRKSKLSSFVPRMKSTSRLDVIHLDSEDERIIRSAASKLGEIPPNSYLRSFLHRRHLLNPEKQLGDLGLATIHKNLQC